MKPIDADKLLQDIEHYHLSDGMFQHWVQIQPAIEPEPQWIPCSEIVDLPGREVLCCNKYGEEMIGYLYYFDNQWICDSECEIMYDPIAYMPLPEPWKGKTDE